MSEVKRRDKTTSNLKILIEQIDRKYKSFQKTGSADRWVTFKGSNRYCCNFLCKQERQQVSGLCEYGINNQSLRPMEYGQELLCDYG